jgi:hypothetical protein
LYGLRSLDNGTGVPLFEPVKICHRPPNPITQDQLRADAAVLMELKRLDRVERKLAADTVARRLSQLGYKDGGKAITGKHVAVWRGQMRNIGTDDPAAKRYSHALQLLKARYPNDPKSAFEYYLLCVTGMHMPTIPRKGAS